MKADDMLRCVGSILFVGLLLWSGVAGCSDDEAPLPPVRFDLCEVATAADGKVQTLTLDDGTLLTPSNVLKPLHPDTLYRLLVGYQRQEDNQAAVHQLQSVLSPFPLPFRGRKVQTDAVKLITLSLAPRYLNLRVGVPRSVGVHHYFAFADEGVEPLATGQLCWTIRLFHDSRNDRPDYMEEVYLSCPLYRRPAALRPGQDSLIFLLNTTEGVRRFTFPIPE